MRDNIKTFLRLVISELDLKGPIFEFGSYQVPGQGDFADLRPLFPGETYVGCDMRAGPGVDRVLNLHSIEQSSETVGTVVCLDTLEHVEDPRTAVKEMWRILQPKGVLIVSSVLNFPIHDYPFDYWRFTPEAFRSLLKPFGTSFVGYQGPDAFPHTIVGVGVKSADADFSGIASSYLSWQRSELQTPRTVRAIKNLIPPILLPIASRFYRALFTRANR